MEAGSGVLRASLSAQSREEEPHLAHSVLGQADRQLEVPEAASKVFIVQPPPLRVSDDGCVSVLVTPGRGSHCAQLGDNVFPSSAVIVVVSVVVEAPAVVFQLIVLNNSVIIVCNKRGSESDV